MTRPVSVAVFGSSVTALLAGDHHPDHLRLTWPAALARLEHAGLRFEVSNHSRVYGLITDCAGVWADPLAQLRPDIVVLQYGLGETFPRLVPRGVVMHLLGLHRHSTPVRDRYWSLAHRALLDLHAVERRIDPRLPTSWSRVPPARFEREMRSVCGRIRRHIGSRLVLMTAYPATSASPYSPAMAARLPAFNAAMRRAAAASGASVFPLDELVAELDPDKCLPDGLHLSSDGHRVVAERLAEQLVREKGLDGR